MARSETYTQGKRAGIKWAITWLHARANEMNDPHAKAILNAAAFNMGVANRKSWPEVTLEQVKQIDALVAPEFATMTPTELLRGILDSMTVAIDDDAEEIVAELDRLGYVIVPKIPTRTTGG